MQLHRIVIWSGVLVWIPFLVLAHGDEDHTRKSTTTSTTQTIPTTQIIATIPPSTAMSSQSSLESAPHAAPQVASTVPMTQEPALTSDDVPIGFWESLSVFPTLHPLVVHFAIVLLLVALPTYGGGLWFRNTAVKIVGALLAFGGWMGAILATNVFHPHTIGLTDAMFAILEEHERYANWTVYASTLAWVLAGLSCVSKLQHRVLELAVVVVMGFSFFSVTLAGHYGAMLTHLYGVGPQGQYLEVDDPH